METRGQHVFGISGELRGSTLKKLTGEEAAYVAGFLDADGCIALHRGKKKDTANGFQISRYLSFTNSDGRILQWLQERIDGLIIDIVNPNSNLQYTQPCYDLRLYRTDEIISLLTQVIPYLVKKKERAKVLLEFCKLRLNGQPYGEREYELVRKFEGIKNDIPISHWLEKQKRKARIPWNKDRRGIYSEETRQAMGAVNKGKHRSPTTEFNKGLIPWNKGVVG